MKNKPLKITNMETISYQYRCEKNTGVIFLVYVNYNDSKKWYECCDVYNNQHFCCDKEDYQNFKY